MAEKLGQGDRGELGLNDFRVDFLNQRIKFELCFQARPREGFGTSFDLRTRQDLAEE
jgi:hypothetical protein